MWEINVRLQVIDRRFFDILPAARNAPLPLIQSQESNKQNTQLQESLAEVQQRLREQESLYVSRLAASENERRRLEQQVATEHVMACDVSRDRVAAARA